MSASTSIDEVESMNKPGRANRTGEGARRRRQDKYRSYMNQFFENKRQAAFEQFMKDFNHDNYMKAMHDAVAGKTSERTKASLSTDIGDGVTHLNYQQSKSKIEVGSVSIDTHRQSNLVVVDYVESGHFAVSDSVFDILDANVLVETVDEPVYESLDILDYSPKSPEYLPYKVEETTALQSLVDYSSLNIVEQLVVEGSVQQNISSEKLRQNVIEKDRVAEVESVVERVLHVDSPLKDLRLKEKGRVCIRENVRFKEIPIVDRVTPIRLHPMRYTVLVYTMQDLNDSYPIEDFIHSLPLKYRRLRRSDQLMKLPYYGKVFTTTRVEDLIICNSHDIATLAHVLPYKISRYKRLLQASPRKLINHGVTTFVSLNNINTDITICKDRGCLMRRCQ